jgi:hypothetical protein
MPQLQYSRLSLLTEVGKVILKSNADEVLKADFFFKSSADEALGNDIYLN